MRVTRSLLALALALAVLLPMGLRAAEPPHTTFSPAPPGAISQNVLLYMAGQAMNSQWRADASKKRVGASSGTTFYQWYLSIYQLDNTTYKLRYQSPMNGAPLDRVAKAHGGGMWFPLQSLSIVGAGEFAHQTVDQLVVSSHQTGADCGAATITVFGYNPHSNKVVRNVTVDNGCSLNATIVRGSNGANDRLRLSGPYYNASAAMCCPTKPNGSATLRFANGRWIESPNYYKVTPGSNI
jgi:hypothetical protein